MDKPEIIPENASIYGDEEWIEKVRKVLDVHFGAGVSTRPPIITARSIASANTLLKDTRTLKDWLERTRELAAIEMELNGIYIAARRLEREYPILAFRGISDIVGLQRDAAWTQYACEVAASCAHAFVMAQLLAPRSESLAPRESDLEPDPKRFEEFCNSLRERRVGVGDEWGGDIRRGNVVGSNVHLPKRFLSGGAFVVHAVPQSASLNPPLQVDLGKLQSRPDLLDEIQSWTDHYSSFNGYHYDHYPVKRRRRNADGLLLYSSQEREDDYSNWYIQFYTNGIVEAVEGRLMSQVLHSQVIPGTAVEQAIAKLLPAILSAQRELGLDGRVWVAITLLARLEYVTVSYDYAVSKGPHRMQRQHRLLLPPFVVDLYDNRSTVMNKLMTVFDSLAHAGGWDKSPNTYE